MLCIVPAMTYYRCIVVHLSQLQHWQTALGGAPVINIEDVTKDADVYIISVKDSAIADIIPSLCNGAMIKYSYIHQVAFLWMCLRVWHNIMEFFIQCRHSQRLSYWILRTYLSLLKVLMI